MLIKTLTDFLVQADTRYQIYDLGRRIRPIDNQTFSQIEQNQCPYPWPLQQHAWLAVLFWNPQLSNEHYIWFLKFPLDERGLLHPAAPSQFLESVAEILGSNLTGNLNEEQQQRLASNPAVFKPAQEKLALLHAMIAEKFHLPPSHWYPDVQTYLDGTPEAKPWEQLGLQGFADYVIRLRHDTPVDSLCRLLPKLDETPLYTLCQLLEQSELPKGVFDSLYQMINRELELAEPNPQKIAMLLRATTGAPQAKRRRQLIAKLLMAAPGTELLLVIAARSFEDLCDNDLLELYLKTLATISEPAVLFCPLYRELVSQPQLRLQLLPLLHTGHTDPDIQKGLDSLLSEMRSGG
ncbi:DUF3549 family protein [Dongshaea marina]|uniref:DUF3549 family protein n=1 Tax=Dongshaea marina TaxID=2047966 RepID=UPI000D3E0AB3|nr:DUF3549 family protein [Dongshaea marina]